ncbi:MAG: apolipoprotein N-acyltransferase [Rickettsiales bacterium]|jgi:apolipoprotein N-acyltransferase|nr:apolipoprotein N-acyltransferase [Rickettsiales bacterium]
MYCLKNKYLKLIFGGAICGLCFAPTFLFFLFIFSFDILLESLYGEYKNDRGIFLIGFLWGYGYFLGNFYWIINPLLFNFPKYAIFIPFALIFAFSFWGCYIGLLFLILYKFKKKFSVENRLILSVFFAVLWIICELCRSYLFFPFPFNLVAYSLGFSPLLIQSVSLFGSYIFGFFVVLIYCCYFVLKKQRTAVNVVIYIFLCLFVVTFGVIKSFEEKRYSDKLGVNVRLLQLNFDEKTKNNPKKMDFVMNEIIENLDARSVNVISESGIPFIVDISVDNYYPFSEDKTIITGAITVKNRRVHNSILIFENGHIIDYYDKRRLVPFGEYLPLRKFLPSAVKNFVGIDFSIGKNKKDFAFVSKIGKISPLVCYEALFAESVNKDANVIVNLTNDIWLGGTGGAYQHFIALKFRAIENKIPVIRVSNNGISGYINEYGRVIQKTKLNTKAILDLKI